jgi:hypothetical protein
MGLWALRSSMMHPTSRRRDFASAHREKVTTEAMTVAVVHANYSDPAR